MEQGQFFKDLAPAGAALVMVAAFAARAATWVLSSQGPCLTSAKRQVPAARPCFRSLHARPRVNSPEEDFLTGKSSWYGGPAPR